GAIYLDQGFDFANRLLINRIFSENLNLESILLSETDFKSRLIEWAQKQHHTIEFKTSLFKESSLNNPLFESEILISGVAVGYGVGDSKKEAEQRAAHSVSQGVSDEESDQILTRADEFGFKE
ncbi:MAG: putative dsRNA-binding protein, partial [Rikenellaceae bacterium]